MRGEPLRRRLLLLVAAAAVPLAAMAGVGLLVLAQEQRAQAEHAGIEITRALGTAVDAELSRSVAVLQGLAIGPALDTGELARYYQSLLRAMETRPDWLAITLADPSGRQLLNTRRPPNEPTTMVLDLSSLHLAVQKRAPVIGAITKGPGGEIGVPVRVPVVRNGEVRYVLTAAMKPDALVEVLNRQRLPDDWVVSVFDASRMRVARSRRHAEFLLQAPSPTLVELMDRAKGDEGAGITAALEGDAIYTAFTRSRLTGWTVAIGIPRSAVDAGAWRSLAAYGGGLLLSLALGALAAVLVGRGIASPMARLRVAALALGRREKVHLPETRILEIREAGAALQAAAREREAHEAEREELLRREREARAAAESASRAKDEFLAMLGHELRNPLGALSNASWLLRDPHASAETAQRARDVVARQTEHLTRLTDDLLDAGRAMLGKIALKRRPVNLATVVDAALTTLQTAARLGNHRVERKLAPVWINADVARVEQVVVNLVGNAVKYTRQGGSIAVTVSASAGEAVLEVADDGAGMPPELLAKVFDPFVQGDRALDRAHGGLGVGLTLVRRLAELHGGFATAASEGADRGSVFRVHFPAIAAPARPAASDAQRAAAPVQGKARDVLIVEDNADAASSLRALLEIAGHRVRHADDGIAGLAALREHAPEVALIDIGLPGIDGYELVRRARAAGGGPLPYLIALTGYGLAEDRNRALEVGFDEHLVKPVDPAVLQALLARINAGSAS